MATYSANASFDAYLDGSSSSTNFGTGTSVECGGQSGKVSTRKEALLEFDISSLPSGAVISAAYLGLYVSYINVGGGWTDGYVQKTLRSDVSESQCTWQIFKTSNNWDFAGCFGAADVTSSGQVAFTAPSSTGWYTNITGLQGLAQDAIDDVLIGGIVRIKLTKNSITDSKYFRFDSRTGTNPPYLHVTYTVPADGAVNFFMFF